jgi:hypothetical protein
MRVRTLIIVLLALSCLAIASPLIGAFPTLRLIEHEHEHANISLGPHVMQAIVIRPNDPGSGGGGTGVIR